MELVKITKTEAYEVLTELDLKIIEEELDEIFHSDNRFDREMTYKYFLENKDTVTLIVYWDGEEVALYRFEAVNKHLIK